MNLLPEVSQSDAWTLRSARDKTMHFCCGAEAAGHALTNGPRRRRPTALSFPNLACARTHKRPSWRPDTCVVACTEMNSYRVITLTMQTVEVETNDTWPMARLRDRGMSDFAMNRQNTLHWETRRQEKICRLEADLCTSCLQSSIVWLFRMCTKRNMRCWKTLWARTNFIFQETFWIAKNYHYLSLVSVTICIRLAISVCRFAL